MKSPIQISACRAKMRAFEKQETENKDRDVTLLVRLKS